MAFRQFNPLNVPEHWERYFTKYPQGMTILESLFEWVSQVDEMTTNVNDWNTYLNDFVQQYDKDIQKTVVAILTDWQESGFLSIVIDEALQTQLDDFEVEIKQIVSDVTEEIVTIKPNGVNDTLAIQTVLNAGKIPRLLAKTYHISGLVMKTNNKILSSGYGTTLKLLPDTPEGTRMLTVNGSNVVIDEMTYIGNITTDVGEQHHAVFIMDITKNIENITVKGIKAIDIRGDGLYVGGNHNHTPKNISVGLVTTENCYRNGVSITGAINLTIESIVSMHSGVIGVDFESDTQGATIQNVKIGNILTSNLGILAAGAGYPFVENVEIGNVVLKKEYADSTPDYMKPLVTDNDGVTFRNARNITIHSLTIDGFPRHAMFFMLVNGERYNENITIMNLFIENCSLTDTAYNSYIQVAGVRTLTIHNLTSAIQATKKLFQGTSKTAIEQNVIVRNVRHTGGTFAYQCGINGSNIWATCDSTVFSGIKEFSRIENSTLSGTTLVGYSDNVIFDGNNLSYTTKEVGGLNIYKTNKLNGVFTA